jgi:ribulose-bisphosphate carboxylase large chain
MIIQYSDFLDLSYKPSGKDLICLFRITPAKGFTMSEAAARVASESSNGTWTGLDVPVHISQLCAKVYQIKGDLAWIAYPQELFELNNMPQIVSSIMGNIFGMKAVDGLRLEDVRWPESIIKSFKGPKYGLRGVRSLLGVKVRPITACVPKPKVGYYPGEHATVGYEAWVGGVDLLKDDENLSNQVFNPFAKRLKASMKMLKQAEKVTGEKKGYLINITAETNEMIKRAKMVKKAGNDFVMVDVLTAGWGAVQSLREATQDLELAIHAHRAFHSTFDRDPRHGVSMKVIVEMARIIGTDTIHIGALGKLEGGRKYVSDNFLKCTTQQNKPINHVLAQDWFGVKPLMPCCSGGLHPGIIKRLIDLLGPEMIIQLGGGIHGHPQGTRAGAQALNEAIEAIMTGVSLKRYSLNHEMLSLALNKWGSVTPK